MSSLSHACAMDDVSRTHSLIPLLIQFVAASYAVQAPFKFSSKLIGFPWAKHSFGFIFSCENLTDIGHNIPLLGMLIMGYLKSRVRASMRCVWEK